MSACLDCGGSECICGWKRRTAELESALLDCQRYVLDNGIDIARVKVAGRVSEALRSTKHPARSAESAS